MFGEHAAYILPAYGVSALVIAGLIGWIRLEFVRQKAQIAELEKQGARRRAARDNG